MTTAAIRAEAALMHVLGSMTISALRRNFLSHFAMARLARNFRVRARQRKFRLRVVIEGPVLPAARIVAGGAIFAQRAVVSVVLAVAIDAARGRVLEARRHVTGFAGHSRVLADQRKCRKIMVESHRRIPRGLAVALLAAHAQLAFMFVIARMAGNARRAQFYLTGR